MCLGKVLIFEFLLTKVWLLLDTVIFICFNCLTKFTKLILFSPFFLLSIKRFTVIINNTNNTVK